MERGKDWQVTLVQEDALLFKVTPDGTVIMRAMSRTEWEAHLEGTGPGGSRRSMADTVRQIVRVDVSSSAASTAPSPSFKAATKS